MGDLRLTLLLCWSISGKDAPIPVAKRRAMFEAG